MTHELLTKLNLVNHPRIVTDFTGDETPEKDNIVLSYNPATGKPIAGIRLDSQEDYEVVTAKAAKAFKEFRKIPAPKRGELIRRIGNAYREVLEELGSLVALEMGKIKAEGIGEVQETIDITDFAVGLSRQMYGITMPSVNAQNTR